MGGATQKLTVTALTPVAVTTTSIGCRSVAIGEDGSVSGWPTTALLISKPNSNSPQIRLQPGQVYQTPSWLGRLLVGDTVCWVQTVTGTTTVFVDEGSG
jgi:hypothetical protein